MTKFQFRTDDIVFREDDPSDFVGKLISGEAEVVRKLSGKDVVLGSIREGEFFGEMGVLENRPRSAAIRAKTDMTVEMIGKNDFLQLISTNSDMSLQLLTRLSERLRTTNNQFADVQFSEKNSTEFSLFGDDEILDFPEENDEEVKMTIHAEPGILDKQIPKEGISIPSYPFMVGRKSNENDEGIERGLGSTDMHLQLIDERPYRLSRHHLTVQKFAGNKYVIRDLNSTLGTEVNGQFLGADFASDFAELKNGNNRVVAGGAESPFVFCITVEL